jgi:hypothetical protein
MRKVFLLMVASFFIYDQQVQGLLTVLVMCTCFVLELQFKAHENKYMHRLECMSLGVSTLTFYCGLYTFVESMDATALTFIAVLIIGGNIIFLLVVAVLFLDVYRIVLNERKALKLLVDNEADGPYTVATITEAELENGEIVQVVQPIRPENGSWMERKTDDIEMEELPGQLTVHEDPSDTPHRASRSYRGSRSVIAQKQDDFIVASRHIEEQDDLTHQQQESALEEQLAAKHKKALVNKLEHDGVEMVTVVEANESKDMTALLDVDGDGVVDAEELAAFDQNGDGVVTADEAAAAAASKEFETNLLDGLDGESFGKMAIPK